MNNHNNQPRSSFALYASWPWKQHIVKTVLFCKTRWPALSTTTNKKYTTADMHRPSITFTG
ncbi:hypothetical protein DERF_004716 [Dermatophagoides farinae]|uniref:Uncharacterized protein n=1 Tax=Dermatophagoides farinae TaxID=6954 RepID=A0A922L800_DERFA|nr:hypothetical protein DERF_004716 [Dermatophagoides farinae]